MFRCWRDCADREAVQALGTVRHLVTVTLEIKAEAPDGIPDGIRRTVSENNEYGTDLISDLSAATDVYVPSCRPPREHDHETGALRA